MHMQCQHMAKNHKIRLKITISATKLPKFQTLYMKLTLLRMNMLEVFRPHSRACDFVHLQTAL